MFVYELSGCGFESSCSRLNFATVSSKEFLGIQATIECGLTLKRVLDIIRAYIILFVFIFLPNMNWIRGGSMTAATSKMERFAIIVNDF